MGAETSSMPFDPICVLVCALLDALGCAPACRCRVRDIWAGDMSDVDTDVVCAGSNPVYVDFMAVHTLPYGAVRSGAVLSVSAPMDAFDGVARALSVWRFCAGNNAGAGGTGIPEILGTSAIERAWSGDPSRRRARMHGQCEGAAGAQFLFRPDCGGNIQFGSHRATHEFRVGCSAGRMGRGELFCLLFPYFCADRADRRRDSFSRGVAGVGVVGADSGDICSLPGNVFALASVLSHCACGDDGRAVMREKFFRTKAEQCGLDARFRPCAEGLFQLECILGMGNSIFFAAIAGASMIAVDEELCVPSMDAEQGAPSAAAASLAPLQSVSGKIKAVLETVRDTVSADVSAAQLHEWLPVLLSRTQEAFRDDPEAFLENAAWIFSPIYLEIERVERASFYNSDALREELIRNGFYEDENSAHTSGAEEEEIPAPDSIAISRLILEEQKKTITFLASAIDRGTADAAAVDDDFLRRERMLDFWFTTVSGGKFADKMEEIISK